MPVFDASGPSGEGCESPIGWTAGQDGLWSPRVSQATQNVNRATIVVLTQLQSSRGWTLATLSVIGN